MSQKQQLLTTALPIIITDKNVLMKKFNELDQAKLTGNTQELSMNEILRRMSEVKQIAKREKDARAKTPEYLPPGGWKIPPKLTSGSGDHSPKRKVVLHRGHTVSDLRHKEPIWTNTLHVSEVVTKAIYRIPDRDPSGKSFGGMILRDIPKDVGLWIPPISGDGDFPEVTKELCSPSFKPILERTLLEAVSKTESVFEAMPQTTDRLRKQKTLVGRDLFEMQQVCSSVVEEEAPPGLSRSKSTLSRSKILSPL